MGFGWREVGKKNCCSCETQLAHESLLRDVWQCSRGTGKDVVGCACCFFLFLASWWLLAVVLAFQESILLGGSQPSP